LKSALSLLQSQHISDVKQLSERIDALQRQIDEQKRRLSEQGQAMFQGFLRLEQQGKQQTEEIKAKFDANDHFAARTWGVVYEQDRNIREIKSDVGIIKGQMVEVRQDIHGLDAKSLSEN
jgi:polyhydroxyalkanoate synthesis regulator phasin